VIPLQGNTVYVGLGFSHQPDSQPYRWVKSLTAILSFMLGTFIFSRVMRYFGPLRRSSVILSLLVQALLCFVSAVLCVTGAVPPNAGYLLPNDFIVLLPLALLAIQASGQIVLARFLGYSEITTVVLTSAYCDLVFDERVFTAGLREDVKRNRRILAALMLLMGAGVGGVLTKHKEIQAALWLAGGLKVGIAFAYVFWQGKGRIRLE
jgi:hypothetical protein